jgi:hypothetical protein
MSNASDPRRFRDDGASLGQFARTFLVVCPRCAARANVMPLSADQSGWRVACAACGFTQDQAEPRNETWAGSYAVDPHFRLPLWLQTPCCGETLWAFNREHLDFIEEYIRATLREGFVGNNTVASRLPEWMVTAKHRDEVLRCIARLQHRECST